MAELSVLEPLDAEALLAALQPTMPDGYTLCFRREGSWYFWKRGGQPGVNSSSKNPDRVVRHAWTHRDAQPVSLVGHAGGEREALFQVVADFSPESIVGVVVRHGEREFELYRNRGPLPWKAFTSTGLYHGDGRSPRAAVEACADAIEKSRAAVLCEADRMLAAMKPGPEVERLNFDEPPRGYVTWDENGYLHFGLEEDGNSLGEFDDGDAVVAASWTHRKLQGDAPGMWSEFDPDDRGSTTDDQQLGEASWGFFDANGVTVVVGWIACKRSEAGWAKHQAWTWCERRARIADRLDGEGIGDFWPVVLTWSDEQVEGVERFLAYPTDNMPEVLSRG